MSTAAFPVSTAPARRGPVSPIHPALVDAFPVAVAYLPIAFAFGLSARDAGLSGAETVGMSLLVNAGASQMLAVAMLVAGQEPMSIVLATFLLNLRHCILGAVLAPALLTWTRWQRALFGVAMTDEMFALLTTRLARGIPAFSYGWRINAVGHFAWISGTVVGFWAGKALGDFKVLGFDYAIVALILAVLVLQISDWRKLVAALTSGMTAVVGVLLGLNAMQIIGLAALGPFAGMAMERLWPRRE